MYLLSNPKNESTPKTKKKENHGGTEDTEVHRDLLISTISFVNLAKRYHEHFKN
jgi:hypothetical protein